MWRIIFAKNIFFFWKTRFDTTFWSNREFVLWKKKFIIYRDFLVLQGSRFISRTFFRQRALLRPYWMMINGAAILVCRAWLVEGKFIVTPDIGGNLSSWIWKLISDFRWIFFLLFFFLFKWKNDPISFCVELDVFCQNIGTWYFFFKIIEEYF